MEEKMNLQRFVLPFALVAASIRVLIDFIPKTLSFGPIAYYSTFFIAFVLEIIFIFYVVNKFKSNNNNSLKLSDALRIGVIIMLIVGLLFSAVSYFYDMYIDPDFQINTALSLVEKFNPEQLEKTREQMIQSRENSSPLGIMVYTLWFVVLGFVMSFIAGSVYKSKEQ